jgi:hypothetical protein
MVDEPGSATHTGLDAMAEAWRAFLGAWADYRIEPVEYRTLDEEQMLVLVRAYGRGKASGVEFSESTRGGAVLFRIRDGRVVRMDAYFGRDRALGRPRARAGGRFVVT